ncbi:hypothetical protein [Salinisphaera hydrothermalis]|uniref:hypothetical protein n=1 Tax=Salinisphaera hydrothermalis TaxID=563188 RepID=UPI00333FD941
MKNLFRTNKQGHNNALWNYFVESTPRRRQWYAERLGAKQGASLDARQRLAKELADSGDGYEIPLDNGFAVFSPGTFAEVDDIVGTVREIIAAREAEVAPGNKDFLQQGYLDAAHLTDESPFLRFALREDVIAAIAGYLGVVPVLAKIDAWKSDNSPSQHHASQLYHCDWDDTTQLKIFIYASDVDIASGPLTLMEAGASDKLRSSIGYTYGRKGYRVNDEVANRVVGREPQHEITGVAGTSVFADTSRCFHYGSRVQEGGQPRLVGFFQFVTPTSFLFPPGGYQQVAPYRGLARDDHSELVRMVLGAI